MRIFTVHLIIFGVGHSLLVWSGSQSQPELQRPWCTATMTSPNTPLAAIGCWGCRLSWRWSCVCFVSHGPESQPKQTMSSSGLFTLHARMCKRLVSVSVWASDRVQLPAAVTRPRRARCASANLCSASLYQDKTHGNSCPHQASLCHRLRFYNYLSLFLVREALSPY